MTATKTYSLSCPICGSRRIRKNLLVEAIHLVAVDPIDGTVHQGSMMDRRNTEVNPTYLCHDCGYENVVPSMFVKEIPS